MQRDVNPGEEEVEEVEARERGVGNPEGKEEEKEDVREERLIKLIIQSKNVWKATGISSSTSSSI